MNLYPFFAFLDHCGMGFSVVLDIFVDFNPKFQLSTRLNILGCNPLGRNQTCAESHFFKEKSSQVTQKSSHDLDFFEKTKKSQSHDFDFF
jgi:hypothetical protein